jgi:hypothetical protein
MKKIIVSFLLIFAVSSVQAQKDSIVNYIDINGKKVSKKKAFSVETLVKKNGLWEVTTYYRNRSVREKGTYVKRNKTYPVGTFYEFYRNKKLKSFYSYNEKSELTGPTKMWFDNGKVSFEGNYGNNEKIGVWKYFHYNGKPATKLYFNDHKLVKTLFYNEDGSKIEADLIEFKKPEFEGGGIKKFVSRIKDVHNRIDFQINGNIYINFTVAVDGSIVNVHTTEKVPQELNRRLKIYFENIKGWTPAIHMSRKIPYVFTLPLNFFVYFE